MDAVPFGPWLSVWGYGNIDFSFRVTAAVESDRDFQRKLAFRGLQKLIFFRPRRGGASSPARPRRLEAGAAKFAIY